MKAWWVLLMVSAPCAAQTYDPVLIPAQIIGAPTTMTPLNLGDDNTARVYLGFDFPYFDQTFNSAWVSSNGFISFQSADHLCCNGEPISQAPRNTIYGFWTDLVSGGNPYYKRNENSFLVGWYATKEYGTNNSETFEISLFNDGNIQFDYGNLALNYHNATAGITGPTWGDNVQLFYGNNPSNMRYQSGLLTYKASTVVDCSVTPMDPSCPPPTSSPAQVITTPTISTIQEAYAADVVADISEAASSLPEPAQEITIAEVSTVTESIAQQVEAVVQPERLSPEQVNALSAIQDMVESKEPQTPNLFGVQTTSEPGGAQSFMVSALQTTSSSNPISEINTSASAGSPAFQANTLEALNMSNGVVPVGSSPVQTEQKNDGDGVGTFEAMVASPAFSAYTQVSLQDRPDFYAIRDIYKNRRLRDANFEMYRMVRTNDAAWREMVDEQYGR